MKYLKKYNEIDIDFKDIIKIIDIKKYLDSVKDILISDYEQVLFEEISEDVIQYYEEDQDEKIDTDNPEDILIALEYLNNEIVGNEDSDNNVYNYTKSEEFDKYIQAHKMGLL
jgi:hypothetical protein